MGMDQNDAAYDPDTQWARIASELASYREQRRSAWGDLDDLTLARFLGGETTAEETARVHRAMADHPKVRECVAILRDVFGQDSEGPAPSSEPPATIPLPKAAGTRARRWLYPWIGLAAAASVLAFTFLPGKPGISVSQGPTLKGQGELRVADNADHDPRTPGPRLRSDVPGRSTGAAPDITTPRTVAVQPPPPANPKHEDAILAPEVVIGESDESIIASAKGVLAKRGLTQSGQLYVLEEADALKKYAEADQVVSGFLAALKQCNAIRGVRAQIAEIERSRVPLWEANADLRNLIAGLATKSEGAGLNQMNAADRSAYKQAEAAIHANNAQVNNLNGTIRRLWKELPPQNQIKAVFEECERRAGACTSSVRDVDYALEPIAAKYRELASDREVKDALATLSRETEENVRLGPSPQFSAAIERLQQAKKALASPRPSDRRKKGGSRRP